MSQGIKESDWKKFRHIRDEALNRYCQNVLLEVKAIIAKPGKSYHERYLAVYRMIHEQDRELARMFNDPRRSRAFLQLLEMRRRRLITDEEFSRFSPELREQVES